MIISEPKGPTVVLLNDRAQGGTSMNDGEMEIMIHRRLTLIFFLKCFVHIWNKIFYINRLLNDDAFGVGEALDETAYGTGLVARGKHWIYICGGGKH